MNGAAAANASIGNRLGLFLPTQCERGVGCTDFDQGKNLCVVVTTGTLEDRDLTFVTDNQVFNVVDFVRADFETVTPESIKDMPPSIHICGDYVSVLNGGATSMCIRGKGVQTDLRQVAQNLQSMNYLDTKVMALGRNTQGDLKVCATVTLFDMPDSNNCDGAAAPPVDQLVCTDAYRH
jgi:hypothetical protein